MGKFRWVVGRGIEGRDYFRLINRKDETGERLTNQQHEGEAREPGAIMVSGKRTSRETCKWSSLRGKEKGHRQIIGGGAKRGTVFSRGRSLDVFRNWRYNGKG